MVILPFKSRRDQKQPRPLRRELKMWRCFLPNIGPRRKDCDEAAGVAEGAVLLQ